jgi:hypothetical protein
MNRRRRDGHDQRLDAELPPSRVRQQPQNHHRRQDRHDRPAGHGKRDPAAGAHVAPLQLVRRGDAHQIHRQGRHIRQDGERRETAADGEGGDEARVDCDRDIGCVKARVDTCEHLGQHAVLCEGEQRAWTAQHVAGDVAEHRDDRAEQHE